MKKIAVTICLLVVANAALAEPECREGYKKVSLQYYLIVKLTGNKYYKATDAMGENLIYCVGT